MTAAEHRILAIVGTALARELDLPGPASIDPDLSFVDLGLDSTGVVVVAGELSDRTGTELAPELLFDFPTPRLLARHLAAMITAATTAAAADGR